MNDRSRYGHKFGGLGVARLFSVTVVVGAVITLDFVGSASYGNSLPTAPLPIAQGPTFPPAVVQEFPTPREVALDLHRGVTSGLSVDDLYTSTLLAGGVEFGSAGFHLAECDYIAKQPPLAVRKTGSDGRNYYLLNRIDGSVLQYSGHTSYTSSSSIISTVADKTHRGCVSIQKPIGNALFTGSSIQDASGQGANLHFQLTQRGIDLLLGHTGGALMASAGLDWAGEWRQAGALITPFDLVLVADNVPIGYLPARDMLEAASFGGVILDIFSSAPVVLTDASALAILSVF